MRVDTAIRKRTTRSPSPGRQDDKEVDRDHRVEQVFDLSGKISLLDLCYILKDASLFVGVDSGLMHLASALDIPVVGIFGPTDPFYVGPLNTRSAAVREEGLDCMPCYLKGCEERLNKNLEAERYFPVLGEES
jgi:ADP-heptose:LPS heptosyltransferase